MMIAMPSTAAIIRFRLNIGWNGTLIGRVAIFERPRMYTINAVKREPSKGLISAIKNRAMTSTTRRPNICVKGSATAPARKQARTNSYISQATKNHHLVRLKRAESHPNLMTKSLSSWISNCSGLLVSCATFLMPSLPDDSFGFDSARRLLSEVIVKPGMNLKILVFSIWTESLTILNWLVRSR